MRGAVPRHAEEVILEKVRYVWWGESGARELVPGVDLLVSRGRVSVLASRSQAPPGARVIDASRLLVLPGLVNAHHHITQQLTRTIAVSDTVDSWITAGYRLWSKITPDIARHGARAAFAELLLGGVTTTADLSYYFPRGREQIFDIQVAAAAEAGCRFLAVRGALTDVGDHVRARLGDSVDLALESRDVLLAEVERVADKYHDPSPDAMTRIGVGTTEPLWDDPVLMHELAGIAADKSLPLHTHLHPRPSDRQAANGELADGLRGLGWWGENLWVAHGTQLNDAEIASMAEAGVSLATCPSSNARLATDIAPAWSLHEAGGTVAIGVDGAASNDSGDLLGECRLAWQVQRHRERTNPRLGEVTPRVILDWATVGGARALGWPGLGELYEGAVADIACFDISTIDFVGTSDPLDALLLCGLSHRAELVIVDGSVVVEGGRLVRHDEDELAWQARRAAALITQ